LSTYGGGGLTGPGGGYRRVVCLQSTVTVSLGLDYNAYTMPPRKSNGNDDIQKAFVRFLFVPLIAVIGIYVVGVAIQDFFELPNAAKYLFWAIGGIGFFALYFRKQLSKFFDND
jgi:hypothetical protein